MAQSNSIGNLNKLLSISDQLSSYTVMAARVA